MRSRSRSTTRASARRLHTAGRAHVTKAAKLGERQVAREHRTPNEVDVLAALAGVGQILVERDEIIGRPA